MNIFSLVFLMHVLERKNEESFDLVEFVASVNLSMGTCATSISSGVFHQIFCFLRKSTHISRIVLRGNVTREFEDNDDDDEGNEKIKKATGLLSKAKTQNVQRNFWQILSPAIIARVPFREFGFRNPRNFCLESEILGFGIRNAANDGNPEFKF